ncbi:MAG: L-2-hydroxyglutarate oxidase [Planctomycetes bacterium]|nr:L-2-hydroxyglutarate oxidase [Planctomycetota bacterium]
MSAAPEVDLAIVGGGIVGLATAERFLARHPGRSVALFEKERALARHQTGRNSGVIHSGIYYKPGSMKARTCLAGKRALEAFCAEENVALETCGKVVVALDELELVQLAKIEERARGNAVPCQRIGKERLAELEPHAAGIAALHVPGTGIVDYPGVCAALARRIERAGGELHLGARATAIGTDGSRVRVASANGVERRARALVNCAGLHSDRVLELAGGSRSARIVPFRGEYYELVPAARHLCRNLIYPVPDPSFPFLGVHFTRLVHGGVECGPNAVLAFAREGYTRGTVVLGDLWDALAYRGFHSLAWKHWRAGLGELHRSFSKAAFVKALQRLCPTIRAEHLVPAPAGVRAQALLEDGALVDDFLIVERGSEVHVLNAPSPAATASLAIADAIVEHVDALLARSSGRAALQTERPA